MKRFRDTNPVDKAMFFEGVFFGSLFMASLIIIGIFTMILIYKIH